MGERVRGTFWFRLLVTAALGGAAYVANRQSVPLAFGLHLLFGGLFSMLAAILYGPWAGAVAAAVGYLPTIQLWGHPFALLSMTLEACVVGFEARRGRAHHTETDLVYWLLVGGPLVMVTYSVGAHIPLMAAGVAALKQAVNGMVNTAGASVLVLGLVWWQRGRRQVPLEVMLATLVTFLVLTPLAAALSWTVRESGNHLRSQVTGEALRAGEVVRAGLVQQLAPSPAGASLVAPVDPDWLAKRVLGLVEAFRMEVVVTDQANIVTISSWEAVRPGTTFQSEFGDVTLFSVTDRVADRTSLGQAEKVAVVQRLPVPELGWQVYVRKPLGEVEYLLYRSYLNSFAIALVMMILLLIVIRLVAYNITRPLVQLAAITVTPEGEMADLLPNYPIWVTEVRAVTAHMEQVGARIKGLIQSLHETQRELERHNVELAVANVHLADEALRDAQTGLRNQRAFRQLVQLWVEENHPFTLVLASVQGLPAYVAAHGHLQSEGFIKHLVGELQHHAALHGGEVYQYGTERFACLFPESSEWLVERMVLALPSVAAGGAVNEPARPRLAVGAARFPEDGQTGQAVAKAAETRLHDAERENLGRKNMPGDLL
jgi:GGDEF domain-containing protein